MIPLLPLDGRVALVTGGASRIDRALALALRSAGAQVVIGAPRGNRHALLALLGPGMAACELDVADEASVERTMRAVLGRFGRLDVLVNNAGAPESTSVMQFERADWGRVLNANVTGASLCTRHAARIMKRQAAGKIINIASAYSVVAPSQQLLVSYAAPRNALVRLTRSDAVALAPLGIQVNAIAPGPAFTTLDTEPHASAFEPAPLRKMPSDRWDGDLTGTCLYLAAGASDHVTGACFAIGRGCSARHASASARPGRARSRHRHHAIDPIGPG